VASWPDALPPDDVSTEAARKRSGAAIVVGGAEAGATAKLSLVTQLLGGRADDLPLESLAALPSESSLSVNAANADEIQAVALLVLSLVYVQRGDHDLARSALTQARARPGLSDDFRSALALDQGYLALTARPPDLPGALAAFDQALASSDSAEARLDRGLAYLRMGDATHWRPDLERAAALAPTDSRPESARCWGFVLDQQPADALAHCDAANRLHAPPSEWEEPRGIANAELGQLGAATSDLRDFQTWLDQQPVERRARCGSRPQDWVQAVAAGREPFDEATLDSLRRE
jgi:tetratricopeptide (TPR) repeat protein